MDSFAISFKAHRFQRELSERLDKENSILAVQNEKLSSVQNELAVTVERLTRSNSELDRFAYAASHDLKSPLRGIRSLADFIAEDLEDENLENKDVLTDLQKMQDRVEKMEELLEGMLAYSRLQRAEVESEELTIGDLVERSTKLLSLGQFQVSVDDQSGLINVVKTPLEQVIRNLLDNAFKHHGSETGQIHVTSSRLDKFVEVSISDDGVGVAPADQECIFTMFRQLKSGSSTQGGMGMGLSMVKKLIESQGGKIRIESELGAGANFIFTWPICKIETQPSIKIPNLSIKTKRVGEICDA
jgi:signal transduction histidine kinase